MRGYTANMKKYFEKDSERIKNVAWQQAVRRGRYIYEIEASLSKV